MSDTNLTWGGETTSEERTMALAAHLLAFILPVAGPGIIWFLKKDTSKFVAYHSLQAAIFQIIAWAIGGATCGVGLLLLILPIVWGIKANKGEWQGYPLIDGVGADK
jgi:uncharacterized Tic20 family protein